MRKVISAIVALFVLSTGISHAVTTPKTLVIIDTGVDMTHNAIKNNISYEVCFAGYNSCPNGQNFMEGPGAATVNQAMLANKEWIHGTSVASAATQTDPSINIIEIRCASLVGVNGYLSCNPNLLSNSLSWVLNNKDKFNIGAVVSPLSLFTGSSCSPVKIQSDLITNLKNSGIPVILPTGNNFNYKFIGNPACIKDSIAISSIDDKGRLALYANYSNLDEVDFAVSGNMSVAKANNTFANDYGTSLSVAVFGADWLMIQKAKGLTYDQEYNLLKSTSSSVTNIMVKVNVPAVNMQGAMK
jgi:Subtilase family